MPNGSVDRRDFLKRAAVGGAAALVPGAAGNAGLHAAQQPPAPTPGTAPVQTKEVDPAGLDMMTTDRPGSDFMTDVIKTLGFEYVSANPGSSFRSLHESFINYGNNRAPEFITCCHEESSVAMAHGYFKIEGKPMAVLSHGTVGLQHAAMALYNAYCDRVPIYLMIGNTLDATQRRPGVEWNHSVQDAAAMVRDFVKWDDLPVSLQHFAESAVRAYKVAMTPPMMPVLLVLDSDLQERPVESEAKLRIPKLTSAVPPQGDSAAVAEAARLLVGAEHPVLVLDRTVRTPAGLKLVVELAEALQAAVVDQFSRMNFPSRHALNQTDRVRAAIAEADVILGLEVLDFWGTVNGLRDQMERSVTRVARPDAKLISVTVGDLYLKSNYQDFQRYTEIDLAIAADAEATLPSLIEAVKRLVTGDRKRVFEQRGLELAKARQASLERARRDATYAWDATPISTARLSAEIWAQIRNEDWSLVSDTFFKSRWPQRLWTFEKPYHYIGGGGGAGEGYGAPAAVGAALANRKHGRLSVNIQSDGDLMYAPGVLWTAAHHKIPLLTIMHNNGGYHQELMHLQRMGARHNRGLTRAHIGTTLANPTIDFAKLAQAQGVHAEGPISDPLALGPAISRAIQVVKRGEPALIDVVMEPR